MLHYLDSLEIQSLQAFAKLFDAEDNFGLQKIIRVGDNSELHLFRSIYFPKEGADVGGAGASIHREKLKAALGALGEAVERYAFAGTKPDYCELSYQDLKKRKLPCMDPESFEVFSPEQSIFKSGEVIGLKRSTRIDWTWFDDALKPGKKVLLPSQFNTIKDFKKPIYFLPCTSGNACSGDEPRAKLGAILELLERDAFQLYWWTKNSPPRIDLTNPCPRLQSALSPFRAELKKTQLFSLKTDLSPSPILAIYQGDPARGEPAFAVSAACRMDPIDAIEKTLNELHHGLSCYRAGVESDPQADYRRDFDKSIWNFADHALLYAYTPMPKAYGFLLQSSQTVRADDLENLKTNSPQKNLEIILQGFRKQGHRLYFRDGSTRELAAAGIFAYRAFSPDLTSIDAIHRYRQLGVRRYYTAPKKLGMRNRPRRFSELNHYPHPFP